MIGERHTPPGAETWSVKVSREIPGEVKHETHPDIHLFGAEKGGKNFEGVNFPISFPPREFPNMSWTFSIVAPNPENPQALAKLKEKIRAAIQENTQTGTPVLMDDLDRRPNTWLYNGDPRRFLTDLMEKVNEELG